MTRFASLGFAMVALLFFRSIIGKSGLGALVLPLPWERRYKGLAALVAAGLAVLILLSGGPKEDPQGFGIAVVLASLFVFWFLCVGRLGHHFREDGLMVLSGKIYGWEDMTAYAVKPDGIRIGLQTEPGNLNSLGSVWLALADAEFRAKVCALLDAHGVLRAEG